MVAYSSREVSWVGYCLVYVNVILIIYVTALLYQLLRKEKVGQHLPSSSSVLVRARSTLLVWWNKPSSAS